jgi:hypothetical protein
LTDYPYYVEIEYPYYPTKNKHQKAIMIKANTLRPAPTGGFYSGEELQKTRSDMVIECLDTINEVLGKLDPKGLMTKAMMGTEEAIPLSHGTPTLPQNSGSFVSENPPPAQQGGERKEMSDKQWDYIMRLCGRDTKMMNYVMEEYARLGLNFAGKDKPTSFQASKIIEHLKEMKGDSK